MRPTEQPEQPFRLDGRQEDGMRASAGSLLGICRGHQQSALALWFASLLRVTRPLIVGMREPGKAAAVTCPHLLYQSQCESSVDFWFQRG
jgi:hypothetical protein